MAGLTAAEWSGGHGQREWTSKNNAATTVLLTRGEWHKVNKLVRCTNSPAKRKRAMSAVVVAHRRLHPFVRSYYSRNVKYVRGSHYCRSSPRVPSL